VRVLAIDPGSTVSTSDVYAGIVAALDRAGHEVYTYALTGRYQFAYDYLQVLWEQRREKDPTIPMPLPEDVAYLACSGALERATWYQPDVILNISSMYFAPMAIVGLRRAGYFVATVLTESPYNDDYQAKIAALSDIAWTNERTSIGALRAANPETRYLRHAYDPLRHRPDRPVADDVPAHDVVFVGTAFAERTWLLEGVDWSGIDLGLYGAWEWDVPGEDGELTAMGLAADSPLRQYVRSGPIPNDQAVALYRRAKIGLNLYRSSVDFAGEGGHRYEAESLNPRAYELAACGAFTISEHRAEVTEVFGPLVPTFTEARQLEILIRCYLADDGARAQVAAQLPAVVAAESFDHRAAQIVADIARVQQERSKPVEQISRSIFARLPLNQR
jgi:spore maturation protein CgeB